MNIFLLLFLSVVMTCSAMEQSSCYFAIEPIKKVDAFFMIERRSEFPHFASSINTEHGWIKYDHTIKRYELSVDKQKFLTKALAIDASQKKVFWPGFSDHNNPSFTKILIGCLAGEHHTEIPDDIELKKDVEHLQLSADNNYLISLYREHNNDNQMRLQAIDLTQKSATTAPFDGIDNFFDISPDSKQLLTIDEKGFMWFKSVETLRGIGYLFKWPMKHACFTDDNNSTIALSDEGVHYILCEGKKPSIPATLAGNYKKVWRSKKPNIFILQDYGNEYHELTLHKDFKN